MIDFELIKKLVMSRGVSGFEYPVKKVIKDSLSSIGVSSYYEDSMGNIIVELGQGDVTALVCAHMDEVGLLVTYVEQDGKLKFRKVGGIDDRVLPGQIVEIYWSENDYIKGVIGLQPPHLQLKRDAQIIPWYDLYIDVGADSRDEVEKLNMRIPCPACLSKTFEVLRNKAIIGRGIDNRVGCYVLIKVAELLSREELRDRKIVLAWTVQEEVGLRGAKALSKMYNPNYIIVIDTVSCCNPVITGDMKLGNGPVLRILDSEFICSLKLLERVYNIARENKVSVQIASAGGTTDALELQEINVHTLPICIPCRYTHTNVEMCYISDISSCIELTYRVLRDLKHV